MSTFAAPQNFPIRNRIISGLSPDGNRFLTLTAADQSLPQINVVLNWQSALKNQER